MCVFSKLTFIHPGRHHNDPKVILICQKWPQSDVEVTPKWSKSVPNSPSYAQDDLQIIPKSSQSAPRVASEWPKLDQGHPYSPKVAPNWHKITPKWLQSTPKLTLKWSQSGSKVTPSVPKWRKDTEKWTTSAPQISQSDGHMQKITFKMLQDHFPWSIFLFLLPIFLLPAPSSRPGGMRGAIESATFAVWQELACRIQTTSPHPQITSCRSQTPSYLPQRPRAFRPADPKCASTWFL